MDKSLSIELTFEIFAQMKRHNGSPNAKVAAIRYESQTRIWKLDSVKKKNQPIVLSALINFFSSFLSTIKKFSLCLKTLRKT